MILGTAYINGNVEKISLEKIILKAIGSNHAAIEKSVGSGAYMVNSLEPKQKPREKNYREYPCFAVYQSIISPVDEAYLYFRSNTKSVQLPCTKISLKNVKLR